jgi:hypothetical protein
MGKPLVRRMSSLNTEATCGTRSANEAAVWRRFQRLFGAWGRQTAGFSLQNAVACRIAGDLYRASAL